MKALFVNLGEIQVCPASWPPRHTGHGWELDISYAQVYAQEGENLLDTFRRLQRNTFRIDGVTFSGLEAIVVAMPASDGLFEATLVFRYCSMDRGEHASATVVNES